MSHQPTIENRDSPVQLSERIRSLDVLRGFALLGILVMNIQSFGLIGAKYFNPMAIGEIRGSSYWVWWMSHVFFDSKFMAIFSMLFGAGIVLMWERANQSGRKFTWLHYRRMFWLLVFGLAHAHLLWYGDILFSYAICGMIVYWVCGWKARWLILSGLILLAIGSGNMLLAGMSVPHWPSEQLAEMTSDWAPPAQVVQQELATYRGSWLTQLPVRSELALEFETFLLAFWSFWRASGLMLIGMGLFKCGVFDLRRSTRFYLVAAVAGAVIGFAIILFGVQKFEAADWSFEYSFFIGTQFNYWGSLFLSLAYVCGVMLICKIGILKTLQRSLAAVGQMALTNYLLQTIICTTIFYGHGLGWFGYLSRVELIPVVFVIWCLQMIGSPIWLQYFRFGPFEWLWRSLSYWRLQPLTLEKPDRASG